MPLPDLPPRAARRRRRSAALASALALALAACSEQPPSTTPEDGPSPGPERTVSIPVRPRGTDAPAGRAGDDIVRSFRDLGGALASRRAAARARLEELGAAANPAAVRSLREIPESVRSGAASHLAAHATPAEAEAVLSELASPDTPEAVRVPLIAALGTIGAPACVEALLGIVEGDDPREAGLAGDALASADVDLPRDRLLAMTGLGNPTHARTAALTALGPGARPEEADLFRAAAADVAPPVRWSAARGLVQLVPGTLAGVRDLVEDPDAGVRGAVLAALLAVGGDSAADVAESALHDDDDDNQAAACAVLAAHPGPRSWDVLVGVLRNVHGDAYVRTAAARGLVALDPRRARPVLAAIAEAETGGVAGECRTALEALAPDAR